jgi:RNA polymerase sigma factor (sigma-70 family)
VQSPPKQQSSVSLAFLIRKAQASDRDDTFAMSEIIRRFEPLADRLANRATTNGHLREDLRNAARLALVQAIRRHDGRLGFPAYVERYMRGAVNREYQRWLPPKVAGEAPAAEPVSTVEPDAAAIVIEHLALWGDGELAKAIEGLTPSQQGIVILRYATDASLKQIATVTGTSSSAVSQRLSTIHRAISSALTA